MRTAVSVVGVCCTCIFFALGAIATKDKHGDSVEITALNFKSVVANDGHVWLLEFYSPQCGSCKDFEPVWRELAKGLKRIKLGRVNIDDKNGLKLAEDLDVLSRSIPAIYAVIETTSNVKATHIETDLGLIIMDGTDTPFPSVPQLRTTIHRYVKTLKLDKANNKFRRNDLSLKSEL